MTPYPLFSLTSLGYQEPPDEPAPYPCGPGPFAEVDEPPISAEVRAAEARLVAAGAGHKSVLRAAVVCFGCGLLALVGFVGALVWEMMPR